MAAAVNFGTKLLVIGCDAKNFFCDARKCAERGGRLEIANAINDAVNASFAGIEQAFLFAEVDSRALEVLKKAELLPRISDVAFKMSQAIKENLENDQKTFFHFFQKGILSPISGVIRVVAQREAYREKGYIEMSEEERAQTTRPIYKRHPQRGTLIKVGEKPICLEECKQNLEQLNRVEINCTFLKTAADLEVATGVVKAVISLHQKLTEYFRPLVNQNPQLSLVALVHIPPIFEQDIVFSRYQCAILLKPIRDPVGDPDGHHIYERAAILEALLRRQVSPMSNLPLELHQLIEKPALKALIDSRLEFYNNQLFDGDANLSLAEALAHPADPLLQAAANAENPDY